MENIIFDGFILIQDSIAISGLPLWCAYLKKASDLNFNIDCIFCVHSKKNLPSTFLNNNRLV